MEIGKFIMSIVEELPDLYEQRHETDVNDSLWDFIEGCIETRITMLYRLGVPELIPVDPYTDGDC